MNKLMKQNQLLGQLHQHHSTNLFDYGEHMTVASLQHFEDMYKQFTPLLGPLIQDYLLVAVKIQHSKFGV